MSKQAVFNTLVLLSWDIIHMKGKVHSYREPVLHMWKLEMDPDSGQ